MSRASTAATNAAVNAVTALGTHVGLNTADPGTAGTGEATGETRQAITWAAAASGSGANTNAISVPLAANTTVPYFSTWNGAAGAYTIGGPLSASVASGASAINVTFAASALSLGAT